MMKVQDGLILKHDLNHVLRILLQNPGERSSKREVIGTAGEGLSGLP
jgi:hypothetical protein